MTSYTTLTDSYIASMLFGGAVAPVPSVWYIGLSTTEPTPESSSFWNFTEPSAQGGYGRVSVANATANFSLPTTPAPQGAMMANAVSLVFPTSSGAWSNGSTPLTYFGFFDSPTLSSGNLWMFGLLVPSVTVLAAGIQVGFGPGQIYNQVV